jgi:hypothetical protein
MDKGGIYLSIFFSRLLCSLPERLKVEVGSDICSDNSSSCAGFLDSEIHYKFREWQSCGMYAFYSSTDSYELIDVCQFSFSVKMLHLYF